MSEKQMILAVDDNSISLATIEQELEGEYEVIPLNSGIRALQFLKKEERKPDLILLDVNMPDMDGYEATSIIRCSNTDVPIIAVTAYAFQADRLRIMDSGFNGYISKPIDADHLMTEIARLLNNGR